MKIYTKKGDQGFTCLGTGDRVLKSDPRVEAYGAVDELSSLLGLARSYIQDEQEMENELRWIQEKLFVIASVLAFLGTSSDEIQEISENDLLHLEAAIDKKMDELPPLTEFIVPGGTKIAAHIHYARSVCRSVERTVVSLLDPILLDTNILPFLNRLGDYLFCAARLVNYRAGESENIAKS
ncbi:MAG: cob(I)yrinic acid a,c-diamide adenosyltransferase [Bacillota bacterium]|nr:cob(I)yrinic acid a,c-diamide adenosyltransferase [Bacillota bacterium]